MNKNNYVNSCLRIKVNNYLNYEKLIHKIIFFLNHANKLRKQVAQFCCNEKLTL